MRFTFSLLLLSIIAATAAPPTLDHLYPAGGQQGTTVTVTAIGKTDPWPAQVWTDTPGLVFKPDKDKGKYLVEVAKDAPAGPHLVRLYNDEGASTVRFFIVSQMREDMDKEPNDEFANPQAVPSLPVVVNGRLDRGGDVDSYAVKLARGQTLIASVDAYRLASTTDALMRIVDTNGVVFAFNHDGRSFDPFMAFEAPQSGDYVIQVMGFPYPATASENLGGGSGYIYRLTLTTNGWLGHAFPPVVSDKEKHPVSLFGWNLGGKGDMTEENLALPALPTPGTTVAMKSPNAGNTLSLPVTTFPLVLESEPNDSREQAGKAAVPASVCGRIQGVGDVDYVSFQARKGDKLSLQVQSASMGFPLDAWLKIEDDNGKELAKADDGRDTPDPVLNWTAPADGRFFAVVGSTLRKGGPDCIYHLEMSLQTPLIEITAVANAFNLTAGQTNDFKLNVRRKNGHSARVAIAAKHLPPGVSALPLEAPSKDGEVSLKLVAAPDAGPVGVPFEIVFSEDGGAEKNVWHELTSRSLNNGVPQGYNTLVIEQIHQYWLGVVAAKAAQKK